MQSANVSIIPFILLLTLVAEVSAFDRDSLAAINKFSAKFGDGFVIHIDSSKCEDWYLGYRQYYQDLPVLKNEATVDSKQDTNASKAKGWIKIKIGLSIAYHLFKGRLIPPLCSHPPNMFSPINFRGEIDFSQKTGVELCINYFSFNCNLSTPYYITPPFCREILTNINLKYRFYNHPKIIPYIKGGGHLRAIRFQTLFWDGTTIANWTYYLGITAGVGLIYCLQSSPFKPATFLEVEDHLSIPLLEFNHSALNWGILLSLWR